MQEYFTTIMVSYNREETIFRAIDSFLRNNYEKKELIIVDNMSNLEYINKLKKYISKHENITLLFSGANCYCGARNRGIDIAKGTYVSFLDDDDQITSDYYETLNEKIQKFNKPDMVRFNSMNVDRENNLLPSVSWTIVNDEQFLDMSNISNEKRMKEMRGKLITSCFIATKLSVVKDTRFLEGIYFEDNAFYFDILNRAKSIIFISDALYLREISTSSMTGSVGKNVDFEMFSRVCVLIDMLIQADMHNITNKKWLHHRVLELHVPKSRLEEAKEIIEEIKNVNINNYEEIIKDEKIREILLKRYKNYNV